MKCIKDSVHGNILIRDELVNTILDTPAFQRLRRIEQTAIRSIYPSARHDRFIHSLGVYYIGHMILKHLFRDFFGLKDKEKDTFEGFSKIQVDTIFKSYLVACLLHDIAHAPFSHTFEEYYGAKKNLFNQLNRELEGHLDNELNIENPNYHEYASAILVCKEYKTVIREEIKADLELVCRMIIGGYYNREKKEHELHNCFISLLHGDVVDADRIDYACRDVWASGYSTSSIDVERIVAAIHIRREPHSSELCVWFDCNALTEISNMLDVRQFQNRYVNNIHSVIYKQALMVKAAEKAAFNNYPETKNETLALQKIINIDECQRNRIADDDLLKLMKDDVGNTFYQEYSSRQYSRYALWKTPDEFFHYFPDVPRGKDLFHEDFMTSVKKCLTGILNTDDIIVCKARYKPAIKLKSLYIVVNDEMVRYTDIHPELQLDLGDCEEEIVFYYLYLPKPNGDNVNLDNERRKIVNILKPVFGKLYPQSNVEYSIYDFIQNAMIKAFEFLNKGDKAAGDKKREQVRNMSKDNPRLEEFIKASGLLDFVEKY